MYLSLEKEKENAAFNYSIKQALKIRKFHVAVMQLRLRIVQSCCFANINQFLFSAFAVVTVVVD